MILDAYYYYLNVPNQMFCSCILEISLILSSHCSQAVFKDFPYLIAIFSPWLMLSKTYYLHASRSRVGRTHWKPCRSVMWNLCRNSGRILLGYLKEKEIGVNCQYMSFYSGKIFMHFINDLDSEITFLFSSHLQDTSKHFKWIISFIQLVIHTVFILTCSGNIWESTCRYL